MVGTHGRSYIGDAISLDAARVVAGNGLALYDRNPSYTHNAPGEFGAMADDAPKPGALSDLPD